MKVTKKRIMYTIAVAFIVVFSTTFSILMTLERMDYRNYLQAQYSKNMYQLIDSVNNIKVDLSKSAIVGSREQSIVVFQDIFRFASIANDKIHSIPVDQEYIEDTSKFLSQVGDFSYSLSKVASEGKDLSEEDYKNIETLKGEADYLLIQLNEVQAEINSGKVKWGEIRKKASVALAKDDKNSISDKFKSIQKQVAQYPALIYDGPFSDNIMDIKPKILKEEKIDVKKAKEIVTQFFGEDKIEDLKEISGDGTTKIPAYRFEVSLKDDEQKIALEVSQNGGKIVYLLLNKSVEKAKKNIEEATKIGGEFLEGIGYKNMKATYALNYNNIAVISYVYYQNNVAIYPDQIKLKVAMDDGRIVGIEAEKYLISHERERKIEDVLVSENDARERVGKRLNVDSVKLALVPTEINKEVLCYEFSGNYNEENFIVYINAITGYEQKILQIINTPNGQLTI
ncbi:germination protein YpeB [Clostridium grantii]|uniref:Germination protein YpeB n=1 Tax=Clostridium grantii DSM 8605 TaxID=1121316 RepID=A0A1M5TKH9_9CLOT|nr:germination protein YpeB [Clostridium grantii]SHH51282.1 germination protein YpeB [Clostridium grantii DSM 8605]